MSSELKDTRDKKLGLYRGSDNYIYIHYNTSHIKTNLYFTTEIWHTIGLSFKSNYISDSVSTTSNEVVRVYLDGETYSTELTNTQFKTFTLSVGKLFNAVTIKDPDMGDYSTYYPMRGQIEMLATRAAFCEVATLNELSNQLKDITKVSEYDELGMLQKVVIRKGVTNCWNAVCDWASNTFDSCVKYVDTAIQSIIENLFGGIDAGNQTTNFILGNDSKPVTFFAENASSWWKIWE